MCTLKRRKRSVLPQHFVHFSSSLLLIGTGPTRCSVDLVVVVVSRPSFLAGRNFASLHVSGSTAPRSWLNGSFWRNSQWTTPFQMFLVAYYQHCTRRTRWCYPWGDSTSVLSLGHHAYNFCEWTTWEHISGFRCPLLVYTCSTLVYSCLGRICRSLRF